jgi:DNA-binding transcriptional ArsR family regulator
VLPDELIEEVARLFGLLSDSTRLRLVRTLHERGELSVGELATSTGASVANTSQHLGRLSAAGIVARRRDGKSVRYRIQDPRIEELCDTVCSSVRERASALARE